MTNEPNRWSYQIGRVTRWIASAGLLIMTAIIAWQVFARYVLNASPAWGEQAALLLMIWYVMLAAAAGVREGFHIRIGAAVDALPDRLRRATILLAHGVVAVFGVTMVIWGTQLMLATWTHVIPTLGLPRGVAYMPMPIAGLLIVGFSLEHITAVLQNREVPATWT
jgi:TRAP-type C4-dicarboxylate transport system permease small subunit